jgi:hypothetical protein
MTIKEFAEKYDVPYHLVYESTYKVPSYSTIRKDREYPEDGLFRETERIIEARMNRHKELYQQARKAFMNLRKGGCP